MLYASAFIGISGGHVPLLVKIPRPRVYLPKIEINRVSHSHGHRAHVIVRGDGGYYSATHTSSRLRNESITIRLSFLFTSFQHTPRISASLSYSGSWGAMPQKAFF